MLTTPPSLLERLRRSPEREAWERFVEMYTPLFFAWAKRLGVGPHDARDLVQDLFAVLVEKLPRFEYEPGKSFRGWLRTVFLNRWRNWRRGQAREAAAVAGVARDQSTALTEPPELEEAEYRRYLVQRALRLMQAEFEPVTWQACWEYVACGRPAQEVAAALGITVNSVYLAKARVLRRLRNELAGLLD